MAFEKNDNTSSELFKATREIAAAFDANNFKYRVDRMEDTSYLETSYSGKNINGIKVVFLTRENENDIAVRAFNIVPLVPEGKRDSVLKAINDCNREYRFIKFVLDEDGTINGAFDMPVSAQSVGDASFEVGLRFANIIDAAYPVFMKAIWG
ncbi:MAG: YbjN domain-containing protein [Oscillospiraceae bacterium]|nr:YbjN domain-containing protein [Oscillospiraceae bacterium]